MKNAVMDILELEDSYLKENVGSVIATDTQLPATKSHFNVMYENIIFLESITDKQINYQAMVLPYEYFMTNLELPTQHIWRTV